METIKEANQVVLAIPPPRWTGIHFVNEGQLPQRDTGHIEFPTDLPDLPQMGAVMKVLFRLDNRFWTKENSPLKEPEGVFPECMTWETTHEGEKENPKEFCFVAFSGGSHVYNLKDEFRESKDVKSYTNWFGNHVLKNQVENENGFSSEDFINSVKSLNWMDWSDIGYSCQAPGEITSIGKKLHSGWKDDKLWLAGEHACLYRAPGFMEGALLSGRLAAMKVVYSAHKSRQNVLNTK